MDSKSQFELNFSAQTSFDNETVILFVGSKKEDLSVHGASKEVVAAIKQLKSEWAFSGKASEVYFVRNLTADLKKVILVGLGSNPNHETIRKGCGQAFRQMKAQKIQKAFVSVTSVESYVKDGLTLGKALAEGFISSSYVFDDLKSAKKDKDSFQGVKAIFLNCTSKAQEKKISEGVSIGKIVGESVNFAKWLGDLPGNHLTPTRFGAETEKAAKGTGLKVSVWGADRIKKEKMGCFLAVSFGSSQEPKFIEMSYQGGAKGKAPICFVGKGLTFDSGGISIKPSSGMEEMKYDMCGGAAVVATMLAIAKLKLKVNAIAYVPATENMPGPAANKPGDVMAARNGKTVEVNNTDAEGRLILSDALVYASEQKPAFIVDAATLTGAIKVALGDFHTGYFCNDTKLNKLIGEASDSSGEALWRMPLTEDHVKDMKGTYADLSNIGGASGAGSAKGAAFLSEFVSEEIPWAHFDIAATAWHQGKLLPYNSDKGASGVIVRTFVELARKHRA
jgi:leucyl aminopeptidase